MIKLVNVADIEDAKTGKTFRELNLEKEHKIPLGSLVEIVCDDQWLETPKNGLRLFVVSHDRDCDGTPLYSLSFNKNWQREPFKSDYIPKIAFLMQTDSGYSEKSLRVIK